jgi:tRNA pseudouridine-54 N-methylase
VKLGEAILLGIKLEDKTIILVCADKNKVKRSENSYTKNLEKNIKESSKDSK